MYFKAVLCTYFRISTMFVKDYVIFDKIKKILRIICIRLKTKRTEYLEIIG